MGGRFSREKGKRGEREVVKILRDTAEKVCYPVKLERNLLQANDGGQDIIGFDWLSVEVKRQEVLHVDKWWQQTLEQCGEGQIPVLFYRMTRRPWRVVMRAELKVIDGERLVAPVEISLDTFLEWFELELYSRLVIMGS